MNAFLKRLAARRRTPLTVSCILAAPLYFLSLMLASMALDRPRIVAWTHDGKLVEHFHPTATGLEAKIWAVALVPSALLIAIGVAAVFIRFGTYLVCACDVRDLGRAAAQARHLAAAPRRSATRAART